MRSSFFQGQTGPSRTFPGRVGAVMPGMARWSERMSKNESKKETIEWRCYKNTLPGHYKFWKVAVVDSTCVVVYGKIGTPGATQVKAFGSRSQAASYADKKIAEKINKGYDRDGKVFDTRSSNATAAISSVQQADKALEQAKAEVTKAEKAKEEAAAKLGEVSSGTGRKIVIILDDDE